MGFSHTLKPVIIAEILGAVVVGAIAVLFLVEDVPNVYLVAGLGLLPTLIPLLAIARRIPELKTEGVVLGPHFLIVAAFSIASVTMAFITG